MHVGDYLYIMTIVESMTLYLLVGLLGLVFGSFAGATVWRLRAKQLLEEKQAGEPVDRAEFKRLKPLNGKSVKNDRSRCLHCGHELKVVDLVPLLSWMSTKGKCRYCDERIGAFEPLMEIGTATAFIVFFHYWQATFGLSLVGIVLFALWLAAVVMLVILFAYDLKWFILPDVVMFPLIAVAAVIVLIIQFSTFGFMDPATWLSIAASVLILSGLYLAIWFFSKGAWVGFGDVKLGLALGLLLMDWRLAFLALFLANLLGTLIVLPGLITKKMNRQTQVPFGPLLIAGFAIALFAGQWLIGLYEGATVWLASAMLML
jgi:leader peptidase (prepilin peptidase)/N-methyltransferase